MTFEMIAFMPPVKLLGLCGAAIYVGSYLMLTTRVLTSESWLYFVLNLTAASFVLVSLSHEFNAAAAVIQTFFIGASLFGLVTRLRRRRPVPRSDRLRPLT